MICTGVLRRQPDQPVILGVKAQVAAEYARAALREHRYSRSSNLYDFSMTRLLATSRRELTHAGHIVT
jgi:hypothetical protein